MFENVLDQYAKFVKPSFEEFLLPSKKHADVIIPGGADNDVVIDLIVQHIRTKLGQHDLCKIYPNIFVIHSTLQIRGMHTLTHIYRLIEAAGITYVSIGHRKMLYEYHKQVLHISPVEPTNADRNWHFEPITETSTYNLSKQ